MAMPQRDDLIDEIQKADILLEFAVQHVDTAEAECLCDKLCHLASLGGR